MRTSYLIAIAVFGMAIALAGGILFRFRAEAFHLASLPAPVFVHTPIALPEASPLRHTEATPLYDICAAAFRDTLSIIDQAAVCTRPKRLTGERGIEVDLTAGRAFLFDGGLLVNAEPVLYQAPEGMWYQAPTGYYSIGVKHQAHLSSLFPVTMPWSLQYYEDFFMHGVPYHADGTPVSTIFTGGCIRFADNVAERLYGFLKPGDQIVVYKTFEDLRLRQEFHAPVDISSAWIRQRFVNPYRAFYRNGGSIDTLKNDYYSHAGADFALYPGGANEAAGNVYAIADGTIELVQKNDGKDHGLGNVVVLGFSAGGGPVSGGDVAGARRYALYAHLDSIAAGIAAGARVRAGDVLGVIGNSGNGCRNYWRVGAEGCASMGPNDTHLHLEIKDAPVLENPRGGEVCRRTDGSARYCYGYTPDYPQKYGYHDPIEFLFQRMPGTTETPSSSSGAL